MRKELLGGSARRVMAVSAVVVAVIATAVAVTIWRYEAAIASSNAALDARKDAVLTTTLVGTFWHQSEAMYEYFAVPSPAFLQQVEAGRNQFAATAAGLVTESPTEARLRTQAVAGDTRFVALFRQVQGAARAGVARETRAAA